jgi:hypothetical protein
MGEAALQRDGVQKQKSQEADSTHFMFYFILILKYGIERWPCRWANNPIPLQISQDFLYEVE